MPPQQVSGTAPRDTLTSEIFFSSVLDPHDPQLRSGWSLPTPMRYSLTAPQSAHWYS